MACINMYSSSGQDHHQQHQGGIPIPISPRISFSNDFVVEQAAAGTSTPAAQQKHLPAAADPDFEFAVGGRPMMAADELFFKGRLLPLREPRAVTTLRDELRAGDADDDDGLWGLPHRPVRSGPIKWKELLGLKKGPAYCGPKKQDKVDGPAPAGAEDGGKAAQDGALS